MGRTNRPDLYAEGKVLDSLLPCSGVEGLSSHVANGAENNQKEIWVSVVHGLIWSFSYRSPYSWGCEPAWITAQCYHNMGTLSQQQKLRLGVAEKPMDLKNIVSTKRILISQYPRQSKEESSKPRSGPWPSIII